jgi:hypothetical protein
MNNIISRLRVEALLRELNKSRAQGVEEVNIQFDIEQNTIKIYQSATEKLKATNVKKEQPEKETLESIINNIL